MSALFKAGFSGTITVSQISDATSAGRALMKTPNNSDGSTAAPVVGNSGGVFTAAIKIGVTAVVTPVNSIETDAGIVTLVE